MGGSLQKLLSGLTRPLTHVVHIGAGAGGDLALYLEAGAKTVTLVEGDAGAVEQLEGLAVAHEGVTVIPAVVSGDTRKRAFWQMNFPDLSSLRAPTGLKELFPGLRVLSKELVIPVDPARLIAPLELSDSGANLLVIEAPGEALGILRALEPDDLLQRFDAIHLQEARVPLYDEAPGADDILAYLVGAGFAARFETSPDDPERPCLSAQLDRMALQHKHRFDALCETLEQVRMLNEELTGRLAAVQETTGAKIAALRAELSGAERQIAQHGEQVGRLNDALANVQGELAGVQQESAQRAEQVDGLQGAREAAALEMAALRDDLAGAQAEAAQVEELKTALEAAQNDASSGKEAQAGTEHRLAQAREEMLKAEGQISLIRDLLLQGQGL